MHVVRITNRYIVSTVYIYVDLSFFCIELDDGECKTIILPLVLYGCETWSLTLREERRLTVFQNRALRRIFGPKRDEVTGGWRKLHNEEPHN
jgi:hypothetical protein